MYSLNQEKPWYLSDEWYVTVEEFDAIRRMNFPKDFIDFFEIAFRTGLHEKDILKFPYSNKDDSVSSLINEEYSYRENNSNIDICETKISYAA